MIIAVCGVQCAAVCGVGYFNLCSVHSVRSSAWMSAAVHADVCGSAPARVRQCAR
jgi:hypothetical protein